MSSRTRWIADMIAAADVPVQKIPQGVRGSKRPPKPKPDKSKPGPKPKDGERYPCGKLKPAAEMAPSIWGRIRAFAVKLGEDARLDSEIARLSLQGDLSNAQAAAALKMGEIYGRYERVMRLRRSAVSPAYASGHGDPDLAEERMTDAQRAVLEERIKATKKAFADLQEDLTKKFTARQRAYLEEVCVENRMAEAMRLPELIEMLDELIASFGERWRHRKGGPVRAERKRPGSATGSADVATLRKALPPIDPPAQLAFRMSLKALRPDLDEAQLEEAWRLHNGLTTAVADRAKFRGEKEIRKSVERGIRIYEDPPKTPVGRAD